MADLYPDFICILTRFPLYISSMLRFCAFTPVEMKFMVAVTNFIYLR